MRLAACALIVAASAYLGWASAREVKAQERLTEAMLSSLEYLKAEISSRLTPVPECARALAETGPDAARGFYSSLCAALPALGEVEFAVIWSACLADLDLTAGARSALDDLGRSLGRFDAAAQYDAIGRCQQALEREAAELHGRAGQSMRLRLGLSVTAGALLAVTLY